MPNVFSERTLMPVSMVVAIIGCVFWLASMTVKSTYMENRVEAIEARESARDSAYTDLMRRLERIDTKVDFIYESVKRRDK